MDFLPTHENVLQVHSLKISVETHLQQITKMASIATEETNEGESVFDLSEETVVTKYKMASEIVQKTLEGLIGECVAGKKVSDICAFGNAVVEFQCKKIFKNKKLH